MIPHLTWRSDFLMLNEASYTIYPQPALFYCSYNEIPSISLMPAYSKIHFAVEAYGYAEDKDAKYVWLFNGDTSRPRLVILAGQGAADCSVKDSPSQKLWFAVWGVPETMHSLVAKFLELYVSPSHIMANAGSRDNLRPRVIGKTVSAVRPANHIDLRFTDRWDK